MGGSDVPAAPDPAKSYEKEIGIYLANLPQMLAAEQSARNTYDPQRIELQQAEQAKYGPTQYAQQLDALHQLDPAGSIIRDQLAQSVSGDLASGYKLPDDFSQELNTQIRGATTAHGGSPLGNAPITAEAAYKGKAALDLYQQHIDNAGQFLGLATPEQQIQNIQPVTPDQSSAYTNPSAGFAGQQFALQNYGNQLGAAQAQGNPWARALTSGAQGYAAGGGGWTGLALGTAAGVAGYNTPTYSDRRLKENIIMVGVSPRGYKVYEFNYKGFDGPASIRYRGVMAQDLLETLPSAVGETDDGWLCVDYNQLDVRFEEVTEDA